MSRFARDTNGIMGLTLSSLGLTIATGILLLVIFSFLFLGNWQRTSELQRIATGFSTIVEGMDTIFYENTTIFRFPDKNYGYHVELSTEYIVVSAQGNFNTEISVKKRFLIHPWLQNHTLNSNWTTGNELHNMYLSSTYHHNGTKSDPIDSANITTVQSYLTNMSTRIQYCLAVQPLQISTGEVVCIEKTFLYYDTDGNGTWAKQNDECQELLLLYQYE